MSDLATTDPVRALRGALERIRIATRRPVGTGSSLDPGLEDDLSIAERALSQIEGGASEVEASSGVVRCVSCRFAYAADEDGRRGPCPRCDLFGETG